MLFCCYCRCVSLSPTLDYFFSFSTQSYEFSMNTYCHYYVAKCVQEMGNWFSTWKKNTRLKRWRNSSSRLGHMKIFLRHFFKSFWAFLFLLFFFFWNSPFFYLECFLCVVYSTLLNCCFYVYDSKFGTISET